MIASPQQIKMSCRVPAQASKLGVEVPQMGAIAAALAALQWTSRVAAALAAIPSRKRASPPPPSSAAPSNPPHTFREDHPEAAEPGPDSLMAQEALDTSPHSPPPFTPFSAGAGQPHAPGGRAPTPVDGDRVPGAEPAQACARLDSSSCVCRPEDGQGLEHRAKLSLADAEGLLQEGKALPVEKALLEELASKVQGAQQWEACLVALVGPNKVSTQRQRRWSFCLH